MLEVAERNQVVYLRVPEPVRLGEASTRLAWEITDACAQIEERDRPPAAVALISGGGAFCVVAPRSAADCDAADPAWAEATAALARLGPPVVAAVGGDAVGPAWELALACDLRLAAAEAHLGSPEVRWGRIPAAGGTQRLARALGPTAALRLLLLGEVLAAPAALELGLVHRLAPASELEARLEELLNGLRAGAPIALGYAKEAVHRAVDLPLADGLRLEADLAALLQTTRDRAEGIRAFLERRPPRFEAR
ncbi:MAG: enoyl-CoA hydratase/isomerase family protein [Chloroflexi bacterium]|nr:enoyl-CoA hydratase/isomerase family protein [Chloroflexota bacterium]